MLVISTRDILYILLGYLCGSVLFARVVGSRLAKKDVTQGTADGNPGTFNAFAQGGFLCGVLTLCGDLLKGFLPVFLYQQGICTEALALVIAAPVLGHVFPVFYHFRGGKGIATTFGCLLGLLPQLLPVGLLIFFFLFFSLIVRISPNYFRTLFTYACVEISLLLFGCPLPVFAAFTLICIAVGVRMLTSKEEKKPLEVGLLWKH